MKNFISLEIMLLFSKITDIGHPTDNGEVALHVQNNTYGTSCQRRWRSKTPEASGSPTGRPGSGQQASHRP